MFKFTEWQILTPSINGRQELVFKIKIKKEDYTLEDFEAMACQFENTSFAIVLAPFQEEKVIDPLPRLRQQLAICIKEYCEASGTNEEWELSAFYIARWISSRTELSKEELEKAIDSYRAWIQQFTN